MAKRTTSTNSNRRAAGANRRTSAASRAAATAASREQNERDRHAPVSLPPGSFDRDALAKSLDTATDKDVSNRDAEVRQAINATDEAPTTATGAPNSLANHSVARVEVALSAGTPNEDGKLAGGVTTTEFRQVFTGADEQPPAEVMPSGLDDDGTGVLAGRSEIMSLEMVEAAPLTAPVDTSVPAKTGATGDAGTTSNADAVEQEIAGGLADSEASTEEDA